MRSQRLGAVMCAVLVSLGLMVPSVGADPPTSDPATAADYGAHWLAAQVTAGGYIEDPGGDPAPGPTLTAAVSLALAGAQGDTFERIVDWMASDVDAVIASGGVDSPGSIGYLLMVVAAADGDPNNFGGVDLVDRLQQTLGDFEAGLYGASDPTFDGVFRQSLAILGLRSHGLAINAAAVTWLEDQQCGAGSPVDAIGGWQAYRADTAVACGPPDPGFFSGPETNSTALAIQAFASLGMSPPLDALAFLSAAQGADGGWPFITGLDVDPNSTALVIQALVSAGEDPMDWATPGGDPWSSLLSWQIGCEADAADIGAFASPFSDGFPDQFASLQGIWGASGSAFPLDTVTFELGAAPCVDPPPTTDPTSPTTSTTNPSGGVTTTSTGSTSRVAATTVATTSPRFAG